VQSIYQAGSAGKCTNELLPLFVVQPTNATVIAGGAALFTSSATSLLPLFYQWIEGATPLPGATNATCLLTNVPASDSGSQFSCVISNANGVITSMVATLTVTTPPPVIQLGAPVVAGGCVQLFFTLTGGSASTFELLQAAQVTGPWVTNTTAVLKTNAPGTSYTFAAPTAGMDEFYRVQSP
jgi:hypothetical protein